MPPAWLLTLHAGLLETFSPIPVPAQVSSSFLHFPFLLLQAFLLSVQAMKNNFLSMVFLHHVEFQYPPCNIIKKITVVSYANYCSVILFQCCFQPLYRLCIKVVCRLIKQKNIGLLQQEPA